VAADLDEAGAFLDELRDFRAEYTAAGNVTFNAKSGRHDDLISAAAVAAWRLTDGAGGFGPPTQFMASVCAGRADRTMRPPAPWVIGLDLGKVNDPTAICVMRKIRVDASEIAETPTVAGVTTAVHRLGNPESTIEAPPIEEQLEEQDRKTKLSLHGPISRGGPLAINFVPPAPAHRFELQPGSAEWRRQEDERLRYELLLNGRAPTEPER
jgi:hypothetical protein